MSGFVAGGTTSTPYPISNDTFWPEIDGQQLRAAMRIDSSVTDARLEVATVNTMIEANRELAGYRAAREAEGIDSLAEVPAPNIKGESQLLHLYRRVIYCGALAELIERYNSFDATNSGDQKVTEEQSSPDQLRRDARKALRTILGISHTTVELL
ncbi:MULTISPECIES: head completion/stabilization protein [Pseudomonas aeruginosa group]|uniref:head completion/stabilization protein n=1 Tax=Pseudomonas aeruginosa group TaxID=136841 RepID=UPI00086856C2|nr:MULTISPECIES: head completion/stabilization protein [Pseudomonas aeruginosa group]MBG4202571.1 head completion/stabilization protein [Pseudomonas aeruginosa]MBM9930696.1 head completion/stabilization protein [Pseudomonas aeruginosa]MBN5515908.1 head completion/stabilization protein [Pseudomonas aeruginosa]MCF1247432.1 head completion/stabilization protein [Pseudomonas aeruginosa]MDY1588510.1 head completion/stabilization protein [Pseudomonas paraeruginosa]